MQNGQGNLGHDIGPNETRLPVDQDPRMIGVDVISNIIEGENGEFEIEYDRAYVPRPPNGVFHEPLDYSQSEPSSETQRSSNRELYHERKRLATFDGKWLAEYPVDPRDLARDGLYYIGPGDKVKCVFCQKCLRGWEFGDVVEQEHRRIYPDCPFVLGRCGRMNVPYNSPDTMQHSYGVKLRPGLKSVSEASPIAVPLVDPMEDVSERLKTFDHRWPSHVPVEPRLIAEAGFYYTGDKDKSKCHACKKIIQEWEKGDDPWREHARHYPQCPFVLATKGAEFVARARQPLYSTNLDDQNSPQSMPHVISAETGNHMLQGGASHRDNGLTQQRDGQLNNPVQVSEAEIPTEDLSRLQIEEDMNSRSVQLFQEVCGPLPEEEVRQILYKIRTEKGPSHRVKPTDFEPYMNSK